jgi:hypothetical protein
MSAPAVAAVVLRNLRRQRSVNPKAMAWVLDLFTIGGAIVVGLVR